MARRSTWRSDGDARDRRIATGEKGFAYVSGRDARWRIWRRSSTPYGSRRRTATRSNNIFSRHLQRRSRAEAAKSRAETAATRVDFLHPGARRGPIMSELPSPMRRSKARPPSAPHASACAPGRIEICGRSVAAPDAAFAGRRRGDRDPRRLRDAGVARSRPCQRPRGWRMISPSTPMLRGRDAGQAAFAIIDRPPTRLDLVRFASGTEDYPDRSTTIVASDRRFAGHGIAPPLNGPGITGRATLAVSPLAERLSRPSLAPNRELFPARRRPAVRRRRKHWRHCRARSAITVGAR